MSENSRKNTYLILIILLIILSIVIFLIVSNIRNKSNKEVPLVSKIEVLKKDTIINNVKSSENYKLQNNLVNKVSETKLKHELYIKNNKIKKTPQKIDYSSDLNYTKTKSYEKGHVKYYVIVGSYQKKSNADKLLFMLKKLGYSNPVILTSKGYYKVSLGVFKKKYIAIQECKNAQANEFSEAWIYEK